MAHLQTTSRRPFRLGRRRYSAVDITPVSKVARMLSVMESTIGTMYVAVLIARLVSLYSARENEERGSDSTEPVERAARLRGETTGSRPETSFGPSPN